MKPVALLLLFALAAPVQAEDDAHRQDRLRTAALNRQAERTTTARDQRAYSNVAADQRGYRAAQQLYARQMAEWRARVAACTAGDYGAC